MRILYASADPQSTCSWWRIMNPLAQIARRNDNVQLAAVSGPCSWVNITSADVVISNGFWTGPMAELMRSAAILGAPTICDVDDEMWKVYDGHPFSDNASGPLYQCLDESLSRANMITVSTHVLERELGVRTQKPCAVIPNAMLPDLPYNMRPRERVILWRGSQWHRRNLESVADQIADIMTDFPDWKLMVFGGIKPHALTERFGRDRFVFVAGSPIHELFSWYSHACTAGVWAAPLINHPFNHAKSHIAFLEATLSGASFVGMNYEGTACVPVDPEELGRRENIGDLGLATLAESEKVFGSALRAAIEEFEAGKASDRVSKARAWVDAKNRTEHWMQRRLDLFEAASKMYRGSRLGAGIA